MADNKNSGTAGVVPVNADLTGEFDFGSSASAAAQGGTIKNAAIFNTSGGGVGIVKLLAIAGVALLAYRIYRSK